MQEVRHAWHACISDKRFYVTAIGCGIAGFEPADIAPLFAAAKEVDNISLPEEFWDQLD